MTHSCSPIVTNIFFLICPLHMSLKTFCHLLSFTCPLFSSLTSNPSWFAPSLPFYTSSPPLTLYLPLQLPSPPQEEESPDNGELRRAESSPTPLKRDRSFSEHDLALLRGEIFPSLSESARLGGAVRLRGDRPRSRTLTGAGPLPNHRGQYTNILTYVY